MRRLRKVNHRVSPRSSTYKPGTTTQVHAAFRVLCKPSVLASGGTANCYTPWYTSGATLRGTLQVAAFHVWGKL
jgi:hypothetical protein